MRISTKKHTEVSTFIDELYTALSVLIEKAGGIGRMKGIGVGAPNGNYYTGTIEYAPNLPWKGIIPLAKLIENKFKLTRNAHQRCQCRRYWRDDVWRCKRNEGFYHDHLRYRSGQWHCC